MIEVATLSVRIIALFLWPVSRNKDRPSQVSLNVKSPEGRADSAALCIAVVEKLSVAEYDKLSPEEQKAHDKAMADQEAAEQAGV